MGNRKKRVVISVLIVLVIIAVSCILNVPANKTKIVLNIWGDEFKENSIQALENESAKERMHGVIQDGVFEDSENEIVQYTVKAFGLPSAGAYYGFYYSPNDVPAAFQNVHCTLKEEGENHWSWSNDGASGITYKISENFYYYKAKF